MTLGHSHIHPLHNMGWPGNLCCNASKDTCKLIMLVRIPVNSLLCILRVYFEFDVFSLEHVSV